MMHKSEKRLIFTRRALILGAGKTLLFSTLLGRMYYLQVLQSNQYQVLSDGNRIASRIIIPPRGHIFDQKGTPLALNENSFRAVLFAEKTTDVEGVLHKLSALIDLGDIERDELIQYVKESKSFHPFLLKDKLSWQEVTAIEYHTPELPGISVEVGQRRHYPLGTMAAHIIGYVGAPTKMDQDEPSLMRAPGYRIGKMGVEKVLDNQLKGTPGTRQIEVTAKRKVLRELQKVEAIPGQNYTLSLHTDLQTYVAQRLSPHYSASAVVLNIPSGHILSLVSHPSFDPNLFVDGISHNNWKILSENPYKPLINKATSGLYAPGSTVKMMVALAALKEGCINPNTRVFCPGYFHIGNHPFHCWAKTGHGNVNVVEAIARSCDVFFYEIARQVGIEAIAEMYHLYGLGEKCLNDFPSEKIGLVPDKKWKMEKKKSSWTVTDTILTSIGQGYVLVTPLQLATMTARLVTGDTSLKPSLFSSSEKLPLLSSIPPSEEHQQLVLQGMKDVVNDPQGAAYKVRINHPHYAIAGKTGTSQVRRISLKEREAGLTKTDHLPWNMREHAIFVGYAPLENPRFVVSVVVEHGGGGAKVAAPVARDILEIAQKLI